MRFFRLLIEGYSGIARLYTEDNGYPKLSFFAVLMLIGFGGLLGYQLNQIIPHPGTFFELVKFLFLNTGGYFWCFIVNFVVGIAMSIHGSLLAVYGLAVFRNEMSMIVWLPIAIIGVGITLVGIFYFMGKFLVLLIVLLILMALVGFFSSRR